MSAAAPRGRQPRGPGNVYMALGTALLVLFAATLLNGPQSATPAIAEIAPVAAQQIVDAPEDQESEFGSADSDGQGDGAEGDGGGNDDGSGDGLKDASGRDPKLAPGADDTKPRHNRCVGLDVPRQIEDPQSPPCVAFWEGDNGGATATGVTATEIRIATNWAPWSKELFDFFNDRFQFYGRRLVAVPNPDYSGGDQADPTDGGCNPRFQQAAAKDAETAKVFASTLYTLCGGGAYAEAVARAEIIYAGVEPMFTEAFMRDHAPYLWQYPMAVDRMFTASGEWACSRFVGGQSTFGGDGTLEKPREFGVIYQPQPGSELRADELKSRLESCNAGEVTVRAIGTRAEAPGASQQEALAIITDMKQAEVTTIFCLCDYIVLSDFGRVASTQTYFPEWLLNSYIALDQNFHLKFTGAPEHLERTVGLTFTPRQNPTYLEPSTWAILESCPGCNPTTTNDVYTKYQYRSLLLLASGIQLAGPNLTPATFEKALQRATFPNPTHPIQAGKVGFRGNSHAMTIDSAEWWWSRTAQSPYSQEQPGAACYLNGGRRLTSYQSLTRVGAGGSPFFSGECDSGAPRND